MSRINIALVLFVFALGGCSVADLDRKLGEVFFDEPVIVDDNGPGGPVDAVALTSEQKDRIEAWLLAQGLNRFGDPAGTWYASGTPLVTASGTVERFDYILDKHQELLDILR